MSSSSSTTTIEPSLDTDPRENLEHWLAAVGDAARKYCATHGNFGALHLASTDELWNAINPPAQAGGQPTPRPVYPRPAPLVGTETPAARVLYANELALYQDHADAEAVLRAALLKSIGQVNRNAIKLPVSGLHSLTTNNIISRMVARHGLRTETDLAKFRAILDEPLTSIDKFDAHTIEFDQNVSKLQTDDPISVYQAYLLYTKTLITLSLLSPSILPTMSQHTPAL